MKCKVNIVKEIENGKHGESTPKGEESDQGGIESTANNWLSEK